MYDEFVWFVRELYNTVEDIQLHTPRFFGNEKKYLIEAIDSTFVSSVGAFVDVFEDKIVEYTGVKFAVATVNGTAALHISLLLSGVEKNTEVITQSLTFVATCNAISYCGAEPVFIDVDRTTLGMSSKSLENFLEQYCEVRNDGRCWNKKTNKIVSACLPMHTYGFPVEIDKINDLCARFNIKLVEDAAESLGSYYKDRHTGSVGSVSAISFNGNKIITTGGGGVILTNDQSLALKAKHITTTAKIQHQWNFDHDQIGFNYRMPNLNAALGVAQFENLTNKINSKRELAGKYYEWCSMHGLVFVKEPVYSKSNYWLNTVIMDDVLQRNKMLIETNSRGVATRPAWTPMHYLPMYKGNLSDDLKNTEWLADRIINLPSGVQV